MDCYAFLFNHFIYYYFYPTFNWNDSASALFLYLHIIWLIFKIDIFSQFNFIFVYN